MKKNGIFITGTDTGVGKTTIGASLISVIVNSGLIVRAVKPIESGCSKNALGDLIPSDALALRKASSFPNSPLHQVIQYKFSEPLAPAIAAERTGEKIDINHCVQAVNQARNNADFVIVEGAGGLLVPISSNLQGEYITVVDFISKLELPVLVIARATLGTINHTLLTVNELKRRNQICLGVILNQNVEKIGIEREDNARILQSLGVTVLAQIPYINSDQLNISLNDFMRSVWIKLFAQKL